jgi:hypothetical protein
MSLLSGSVVGSHVALATTAIARTAVKAMMRRNVECIHCSFPLPDAAFPPRSPLVFYSGSPNGVNEKAWNSKVMLLATKL